MTSQPSNHLNKRFVYQRGNPEKGVVVEKDGLLWYLEGYPGWAYGSASTQSYDNFIKNGPRLSGLTEEMLAELIVIVEEITGKTIEWQASLKD